MEQDRWIVVADSPFLPARGGGEREHVGFVTAAVATGSLCLLVIPSERQLDSGPYDALLSGAPLLTTPRRTNPLLLAHPWRPYVVASRPATAELVGQVRAAAPDATGIVLFSYKSWEIGRALVRATGLPAVLRQHNLEGVYHRSLARATPGLRGLVLSVESARIMRDERRVDRAPWLAATADISAHDAEVRRARGAHAVHVPPFAFDPVLAGLERQPRPERRVLFLGALDVPTNTAALDWLLSGPWDQIRSRVADAVLQVVGRGPSAALRSRLAQVPGVELHADVPSLHPFLAEAAVAVNPAVTGSGVNIKLIDYLQAGLPVVSTTLGSRGLALEPGSDLATADQPAQFAAAVVALLTDPVGAERLGAAGRATVAMQLDPQTNIRRLGEALRSGQPRPGTGDRPAGAVSIAGAGSGTARVAAQLESVEEMVGAGLQDWTNLFAAQRGIANPFCAPEWVHTWYEHFTDPQDRCLITVRDGEKLIGVAPFFRNRVSLSRLPLATRIQMVGGNQGSALLELPQILAAPGREREVLRTVVQSTGSDPALRRNASWCEVSVADAHGWFEPEWSYGSDQPVAFFRPQMARASVVLPLQGDWAATRAGLKRNIKESLRRSRNRLAKDGRPWRVDWRTDDVDVDCVNGLLELHGDRSAHEAGVRHHDSFADPARQAFLRELLPKLGRQGLATILELRLADELVAAQLVLHAPGVAYLHSSGFRASAWQLGPVTHLQGLMVERAADAGDRWVNFSPGPNVAKLRWSESVDVHHDYAYGSGAASLRWRYGVFAAGQSLRQVSHAIDMAAENQAPSRTS